MILEFLEFPSVDDTFPVPSFLLAVRTSARRQHYEEGRVERSECSGTSRASCSERPRGGSQGKPGGLGPELRTGASWQLVGGCVCIPSGPDRRVLL